MQETNEGSAGATGEVFSHSRLSAFERCPRKFQYRYLWKIPAEGESIEGFVGKRVHEVLERLHRVTEQHGDAPSLPRVIWRFQQMFAEAYDASRVRIAREGTPLDFYRAFGEQCLRNYYDEHYPFDRDETLALEEHVRFSLGDGRYAVQGFVDRIARTRDGAIEIQDYKTSRRMPSQAEVDEDRQLALYQIGVGERFGARRPVRLVWRFLRHRRTLVSTRTPEQLDELAAQTRSLIDQIRSETRFEPNPSALCRWCEYREGCPASPERRADRSPYAPRNARHPSEAPAQLALMF